ncbi:PP2C family protein-serine/threonine phosphatase [Pseudonocardia alaniniphila]|uniref:SpoIIE family protein phosphatase n=1 Tax=Pseudonocardia alaniniphila TaxID=75291 RepID=A0ABS9TKV8_9PSEU|nr:GAF domain-containing SpoIIE family protein phosphatase [Pseudonocardia alaniniphila]MCH6169174.1 SpoIIE family protein phosphatase [Pseudonocardia alaniniphila]
MSLEDAPVESPEQRLHRIEVVTDADLAHLDVEDLLTALLERVRLLLDVDTAAVLLLDPSGSQLVATAARGIEEEVQQGVRIPLGKGFAGRIAAEKQPVVLDEVNTGNVQNPLLLRRGIRSLLGVPLLNEGRVLGVLHVGTLHPRRFTEEDTHLLQLVGDRVALATQARLSHTDRTAAAALQRSLLPAALPSVPGLEFAARYVPGDGSVGGDWYDVFALPSGRLCLVMGDVAGSGLTAAVTMGRLRTVVRACALELDDPALILAKVDEHIRHFESTTLATVLCATLELDHQTLLISTAGHPPPAVARPGADAALLEVHHDLPLGVDPHWPRHSTAASLTPGSSICFYTDGLVERRSASLDDGFDRLCEAMTTDNAERLCAVIMAQLVGRDLVHDDIAILTVSREAVPPTNG